MKTCLIPFVLWGGLLFAQSPAVQISYGAGGLKSVAYNGTQYLSNGNFGVNAVSFIKPGGKPYAGATSGTASYDPAHLRTAIAFKWGSVTATYAVSGSRLNVAIAVTNTSTLTIQSIILEPFDLQLPVAPPEFDGVDPMIAINNGNPTALRMTAGPNALVLANDDVVQPLLVGFPWSLNKPANTVFPVRVETGQDAMLPNSIPFVNRPIVPGATDTYHLSLRFGPASASTKTLVSDLYQSFATLFPFSVRWPDRRPIGQLIIGTTAAGYPTNPRGWFNDPTVDVTTPGSVAAFQSRLLAWAQNAVTILKSQNAQGMITWDVEGEQYPQPTTYIGDPAQLATLAPEMTTVADQYFKVFTSAGLLAGICIRPQQLVIPPGGGAPTQNAVADPTQVLLAKVAFAHDRWGVKLFYIDSNGDPNYPLSSTFFRTVAAKYPDVLLIPEHQTATYFGFGSWYGELRGGVTGTPPSVLDIYPGAFSVVYLPDGPFAQQQAALQASAKRGDIMMFRAWYPDPQNTNLQLLYPPNGVAGPAPSIVTPQNESAIGGFAALSSQVAAGPAALAGLQYSVDGAPAGPLLTVAPYSYAVDTSQLTRGLHEIEVTAWDTIGDVGYTATEVFVAPLNPEPPALAFLAPSVNSPLYGLVLANAAVNENAAIAAVQFAIDGVPIGAAQTLPPYAAYFDTTALANGPHVLGATASDEAGQSATIAETIQIVNTPLSAAIVAPLPGAVVTGTVGVSAAVSASAPLTGLQFVVDGASVAWLGAAPFTFGWVSNTVGNGPHTLGVVAYDTLGHISAASAPIDVQNGVATGLLTGAVWTPQTPQNLTGPGSVDWVHWGLNGAGSVDRKAGVPPAIGAVTPVGRGATAAYGNNPFAFAWSDGAPDAQVPGTPTGIYVVGAGNGFSFSVSADTTVRTLTVYTGVYRAGEEFSATLSDGAAPAYLDTSVSDLGGQTSAAYTLVYQAGSAGQSLTIRLIQNGQGPDPWSNVTLQAAALGSN